MSFEHTNLPQITTMTQDKILKSSYLKVLESEKRQTGFVEQWGI